MNPDSETAPAGEDYIYLLSRSSLEDFLDFMKSWPVDAPDLDRRQLVKDWKTARSTMERLRASEPDWADGAGLGPLPAAMKPLLDHVRTDPIFTRAFCEGPVEFGMVELDRLVVSQKLVSVAHVNRLKERLGPGPAPEEVFRFCLPYDHPTAGHRAGRVADDAFAFLSESNDLRHLETVLLRPDQLVNFQSTGPVAGVVGVVVGYGSNYLNVIAAGGRLLLNNGHHRACALRDLGLTHVPCAVQTASRPEELDLLAPRAVLRNPAFYLSEPRPPALKDYFDPRLCRLARLAMGTKEVRVRYSVEERDIP